MLRDRGYDLREDQPLSMNISEDRSIQWMKVQHASDSHRWILIWCFCKEKLNTDGIKLLLSTLEEERIAHGYVIFQQTITTSVKKILKSLYRFEIEVFSKEELQYNLTHFHYYRPHHRCSPEESQIVLRQWTSSALPILLSTDPVSRYFHFQKNDIIRIERKDQKIAYRIVV